VTVSTPSQTVGPFFRFGLGWLGPDDEVADPVAVHGTVLDGAGDPVPDGVVEAWQADPGVFRRSLTDEDGRYRVVITRPASAGVGGEAPHIDVSVFARGLLQRLVTRVYFPDHPADADPVLASIPEPRRHTLIAVPDAGGLRFDIRLQGDEETVFFAW
jgi:protocatechuate 3,4-dioxygenase alpha subunit